MSDFYEIHFSSLVGMADGNQPIEHSGSYAFDQQNRPHVMNPNLCMIASTDWVQTAAFLLNRMQAPTGRVWRVNLP